ncbi:MAG: hypothetical protein EXS38_11010 [Opitutus sp.]|nr:hypothetical protein [Opitutus sp.]
MKTIFALLVLLVVAGSLLGQPRLPEKKTAPVAKDAAGTPAAPAEKDTKKKEEPPAKIEGMEIARSGGGFLSLQIVNGTFKMSFYDAKKKATRPNVARAILRWDGKYKAPPERVVLLPGGGSNSFISERTVTPPSLQFQTGDSLAPGRARGHGAGRREL